MPTYKNVKINKTKQKTEKKTIQMDSKSVTVLYCMTQSENVGSVALTLLYTLISDTAS